MFSWYCNSWHRRQRSNNALCTPVLKCLMLYNWWIFFEIRMTKLLYYKLKCVYWSNPICYRAWSAFIKVYRNIWDIFIFDNLLQYCTFYQLLRGEVFLLYIPLLAMECLSDSSCSLLMPEISPKLKRENCVLLCLTLCLD